MLGGTYSGTLSYLTETIDYTLRISLPGLSAIKLIFVLHALRLSVAYHAVRSTSSSWVQGLIAVCAMPMSSGLVAGVLTGTVPPFLLSDTVMPTYIATFLIVHLLMTLIRPSQLQRIKLAKRVGFLTTPIDAILKCSNFCIAGVDALKTHLIPTLRNTLFAPIFVGGTIGCAGFMSLKTFGLFSTWSFSSAALDAQEGLAWDIWGPYALSALYIALQGSDNRVNAMVQQFSRGNITYKTRYFSREEARTVIICIQVFVQFLRLSGIWLASLPFTAHQIARVPRSRKDQ